MAAEEANSGSGMRGGDGTEREKKQQQQRSNSQYPRKLICSYCPFSAKLAAEID